MTTKIKIITTISVACLAIIGLSLRISYPASSNKPDVVFEEFHESLDDFALPGRIPPNRIVTDGDLSKPGGKIVYESGLTIESLPDNNEEKQESKTSSETQPPKKYQDVD